MKLSMLVEQESWPIKGSFTISRGAKTVAEVIICRLSAHGHAGNHFGRGECVPYQRYGETVQSVMAQMLGAKRAIEAGATRAELLALLPAGAARNAIDCALWDLEARQSGKPVASLVCSTMPLPLTTAVTISLASPQEMAQATRAKGQHPLIKAKLGGEGDEQRIVALCQAAPHAKIILDANEAWTPKSLPALMELSARHGVTLIEQPLPAGEDAILARIARPVPVCADESAHTSAGLDALRERYDAVNIKLDKTGGLTEALAMKQRAQALGFSVMAGCMVATSLSMAPAVLLAQGVAFADLDGPLILAKDREHGLSYADGRVFPPTPALWG